MPTGQASLTLLMPGTGPSCFSLIVFIPPGWFIQQLKGGVQFSRYLQTSGHPKKVKFKYGAWGRTGWMIAAAAMMFFHEMLWISPGASCKGALLQRGER